MTDMPVPPPPPAPPRQSKGCWLYGCLGLGVVGLAVVIGLFMAGRYAYKSFRGAIEQYTETRPADFEPIQLSPEEVKVLEDRVRTFRQSIATPTATGEELQLSGDELIKWLSMSDAQGQLTNYLRLRIDGSTLLATASVPLDKLGALAMPGRHLNGEAALGLSFSEGSLAVSLQDFKVQGKSLPPEVMVALRQSDISKRLQEIPEISALLKKLESLEVKDGKLLLRSKAASP